MPQRDRNAGSTGSPPTVPYDFMRSPRAPFDIHTSSLSISPDHSHLCDHIRHHTTITAVRPIPLDTESTIVRHGLPHPSPTTAPSLPTITKRLGDPETRPG
ncbi:hypothetical protein LTR28_006936, partial [Elasticomyces elasticus]